MIECTDSYIYYKKRNKKNKKAIVKILVVILIVAVIFFHYKINVTTQLTNAIKNNAYMYQAEAVNNSVIQTLNINDNYSNLINVERSKNGDIQLITTNTQKINYINKNISLSTSALLKSMLKKGVQIPFGAFLGFGVFSGYGPIVNFNTLNVSSVSCNFLSEFKSVGINQTLHSIYVEVDSKVTIDYLFKEDEVVFKNKVLITETVLVGEVPEVYFNNDLFK